jgi:hypothetical protein
MYESPPNLEFVCSYSATLAPPEVIGPVAEGIRVNFYITGGRLEGPGRTGRLRPVGADWLTIRPDGIGVLDVRGTIEMDDGALIDAAYRGIADFGEDGMARFVRGELPPTLALRTTPILRSAHPAYRWMQRTVFVGIGTANFADLTVAYDLYAVR